MLRFSGCLKVFIMPRLCALRPCLMKFAFLILYLVSFLPHCLLRAAAAVLGRLCYWLVWPRRRVGAVNLRLCFPQWTQRQCRQVLKKHFYHMALLVLEYGVCWYARPQRIRALVSYRDKHYLDDILAEGGRVILLYPHFTAFELAVYALNQDVALTSVYSHQKNAQLDARILQGRQRFNNVFLVGRTEGLRAVIRQIRENPAPFLYLPDQDFGAKDSVFVPFFGVQTATVDALPRIAKLTGAQVVPLVPRRLADGRVELRFYPPWPDAAADTPEAGARRMNAFIEERVHEMPEQYFWLHKRFKTRPQGEEGVYG